MNNQIITSDADSIVTFAIAVYKKLFHVENIDGDIYINGILSEVSSLSYSFQNILHLRYCENKTYREIGEIFGLSAERIKQIESKIFFKLRHPSRLNKMRVSYIVNQKESLKNELEEIKKIHQVLVNRCATMESTLSQNELDNLDDLVKKQWKNTASIVELNLSYRLYNCLLKAGITTVAGVMELKSYNDIIAFRHLGKKCAYELIQAMHDAGFDEWANIVLPLKK